MSAPEQVSFLTIAERELSAGAATNEGGKLIVTQLNLVAGKEFDDARDELKDFVGAQPAVIVQSALPFAVLQVKAGGIASADALLAAVHKTSGMDAADTRIAVIESASGPVLVSISKSALAAAIQQASGTGAKNVKLFCRGVDTLAALVESVDSGKIDKPVLLLDILNASTRLIVASKGNIADLGTIDTGTDAILEQVMAALSLKFPGSAAKLFYGDLYDFDEHASKLISVLSEKAKAHLGQMNGKAPAPAYLYASGLPSSRTALLGGKLAEALGITFANSPLSLEGSGIPPYFAEASLGVAKIVQSAGNGAWMLNLNEAEADAAALVAKLGAKPAAPVAQAPEKPETPVANGKPATPSQPAKPGATSGKPLQFQQKPGQKKFDTIKKPAAPAPAKPVAAAPAQKPVAPAAQPAGKPAAMTAPKPAAKKNNVALYGGIAAAVVVIAVVAMIMSGGKKTAPAKETAPAKTAVQAPEPAKQAAPEPVKPAPVAPAAPAQQTPAPAPVVVAEQPAPEPPPPPTTGNLSIQTKPVDAEIYIDGQLKGLSPLMAYDMPIGTYTVEIRKDSYKSYKKTIEIVGGQTETLKNIALELDRGKLAIGSEPDDVSFTIKPLSRGAGADNPAHLSGKTPVQIDDLAPGKYLITYSRDGWKPYEQTVEVKAGDKAKTSFEYKPGKVRIVTDPKNAVVYSNGKKVGETPLNLDDVPEGPFEASIRLSGYEPEVVSADIAFGGSVSRELTLLRIDRVVTNAAELEVLPSRDGGTVLTGPSAALGGFSGTLNVRCVIAASGKVESSEIVLVPSTMSLPAEAFIRNAINSWKFNPGSRKGIAMRSEVVIPVTVRAQ